MSQTTTARALARCESCARTYRVADPERAYACKACGGIVRAVDDALPAAEHGEARKLCTDCQSPNPPQRETCSECGADLAEAELAHDAEEAAELIDAARDALRRASRWSRSISWTYHLGALVYAAATVLAVLALRRTDVPLDGGVLVVVLTTLTSVVMGTAALHLLFQPFLWVLSVALLATGVAVVHALGPNPFGLALLGSTAWAGLSWVLLVPAGRFRSLIEHHKDLYVMHHASQATKRSLKGRTPGERHARLMLAMRHADRRAWRVSATMGAVLVVAATAGTWTIVSHARPRVAGEALRGFEAAWNGGSVSAVVPLLDPRVREARGTWLAAVTAGHGWTDRLPPLPEGARTEGTDTLVVDYDLDGIPLRASFVLDGIEWRLADVELPYPPIEPTLERFRAAWNASDPAALAAFFAPENRAERQETFESWRSKRDWEVFPPIVGAGLQPDGERRAIVTFDLGWDTFASRWFFRDDGAWGLYDLQMPGKRPAAAGEAR